MCDKPTACSVHWVFVRPHLCGTWLLPCWIFVIPFFQAALICLISWLFSRTTGIYLSEKSCDKLHEHLPSTKRGQTKLMPSWWTWCSFYSSRVRYIHQESIKTKYRTKGKVITGLENNDMSLLCLQLVLLHLCVKLLQVYPKVTTEKTKNVLNG